MFQLIAMAVALNGQVTPLKADEIAPSGFEVQVKEFDFAQGKRPTQFVADEFFTKESVVFYVIPSSDWTSYSARLAEIGGKLTTDKTITAQENALTSVIQRVTTNVRVNEFRVTQSKGRNWFYLCQSKCQMDGDREIGRATLWQATLPVKPGAVVVVRPMTTELSNKLMLVRYNEHRTVPQAVQD